MDSLDYELTGPIGEKATFGLVALQTDETVEPELQSVFSRDAELCARCRRLLD